MIKLTKGEKEVQATVRKTSSGRYIDLAKDTFAKKGIKHLTDKQLMELFEKLRLRFTLTPQCNIFCVFCSNEGSSYTSKREFHADIDLVIKLSEMLLETTPLKSIDFSGGEPTIHPDFTSREYKLVKFTKKYPRIRFSLHSNGIELTPEVIDQLGGHFSRIGVSIHSFNFETWNKISNQGNFFSKEVQKRKFEKMMKNIDYLNKQKIGHKVFIKSVVMRGINDSEEELKLLLDKCARYNFHPKFLQFEPQYPQQQKYVVGRKELFGKLDRLGCKFANDAPRDNDPNRYIPGVNFEYEGKTGTQPGLHSIFGCGEKGACISCYDFLCMFVKPHSNTKGLYLKPCSVLDTRIDLTHAIQTRDSKQLLDLFRISREYLMLAPGLGCNGWNKERSFAKNACP